MKIGTFLNFKREEDIQIQTAVGRLLFKLTLANDAISADLSNILIRLRIFGSRGSVPVIDTRTPLSVLFEIAAQKEGFYRIEEAGANIVIRGMVEISSEGALALNADQYMSLDVDSANLIDKMELWAVGGPVASNTYIRYTPLTVQETVKDVPLSGIDSLVFRPGEIDNLKLQYTDASPEYEREELEAIACSINDLVSVNFTTGTVRAGWSEWMTLKTKDATRATISPNAGGEKFTIYSLSTAKL